MKNILFFYQEINTKLFSKNFLELNSEFEISIVEGFDTLEICRFSSEEFNLYYCTVKHQVKIDFLMDTQIINDIYNLFNTIEPDFPKLALFHYSDFIKHNPKRTTFYNVPTSLNLNNSIIKAFSGGHEGILQDLITTAGEFCRNQGKLGLILTSIWNHFFIIPDDNS
ncbi:hypothetical protein VB796_21560 [Arcicella sp. LKC2W]|uniref:hypothetical protein n=1 Tax=Arcicella sp. LKC2W TaxID=2984198 RepID=UPI002B209C9B|nr:hypothetical protein [Arcicella sp. LKC2W]MEA5461670.1 hypothetical protein [Arcicella sp. LKC2W]